VAKNKNQNRRREQYDERPGATVKSAEQAGAAALAEDPGPAADPAGRRRQKRFGHN
jgi:hypothetical protein